MTSVVQTFKLKNKNIGSREWQMRAIHVTEDVISFLYLLGLDEAAYLEHELLDDDNRKLMSFTNKIILDNIEL